MGACGVEPLKLVGPVYRVPVNMGRPAHRMLYVLTQARLSNLFRKQQSTTGLGSNGAVAAQVIPEEACSDDT